MKKKSTFIYLLLALLLTGIPACTDDAPGDDLAAPEMIADGANNVARTTCTVAGKFSGNLSKISEYGVKYSTSYNFPTDATTTVTFSGQPSASVSAELESLSPNTHYYYCWYATTGRTLVTSEYGEFTTTSTSKPSFSEITVDSISENFMRLRCRVIEVGDQYLVEQGVSYRVRSNAAANFIPVTSDNIDSNNEYTVDIADLSAATTYEIRPYAKNSADLEGASGMLEGYGDTQTVTTENKLSPELETYDATDVTMNSARLLAKVTSAEGSYGVITERGFCYSTTSQLPTIYDKYVVVSGTEVGTVFETTLTDLDQLTTYYVRPYAKNMVDWQERVGYGTAIEFTTSRFAAPQVSFTNQDDATVTTTSIALQAQIDNYYPTALQERGFIWSTDDKNISIDNAKSTGNYLTVTTTDKVFSGTITNLEPSTTYYIRAYAIYKASNETLSGLSEAVVYSTSDVSAGSFKNITCTNKTTTSLTLNTGVSDLGDGVLTEMGFVWRAGSGVAVTLDNCDGSQVVQSENSYDYSATLIGLQQATGYTVRGYVKTTYNWQTYIAYSDALYCETNDFTAATVKDITCTAQTISSLTVESGITDMGNGTLVEKGFIYKAGNNGTPTLENYDGLSKVEGTAQGAYSATLTGLTYSTDYRVRSYVKTTLDGKTQVAYSNILTATTSDLTGATLNAPTCTAQTTSSLTIETGVEDLGDGEPKEKGICWRVADGVVPTLDNCDGSLTSSEASYYSYSASITGLQSATSYSVRAYVKTTLNWEELIYYSDAVTFTTNDFTAATLKDITCTAQTTTTLTVESGISDLGNGTLEEKGFIWKAGNTGTPTVDSCDGTYKVTDAAQSSYTATLSGLNYSTEYRVRSYVKTTLDGKTQVSYSSTITAATSDLTGVTFKTSSCTSQTTASLTVESGITDLGDGEFSEKGFCWRVSDGVTPTLDNCDGSQASSSTSNESFSYTITGLQSATTYSVRPYVKTTYNWEAFVSYGDVITCTTNDYVAATLKDISCTAQTTTTLTVEGGITDMGNGTLEEKGFIWKSSNSATPTLENNDGSITVTGTENSSYTATLTGLNYSSEYRIRGYVKTLVDGKSVTAYTNTITGTTTGLTATTFTTPTSTTQTTSTLTIQAGVDKLGDGEITEKGICWRVSDGILPTLDNCDGSQVSTDASYYNYTTTATGLKSATTYSIRAYVKMMLNWEELIYYSEEFTAKTNEFVLATMKSISCTAQTTTSLTVETGISDLGNGEFVEKGFLWRAGSSGTPSFENEDCSVKVEGTEQSTYSATITGLQIGTAYRLRGYTKTLCEGTTLIAYTEIITSTTEDKIAATLNSVTTTLYDEININASCGVNNLGNGELVEKGFCWKVDSSPTLQECDGSIVVTDGSDDSFSAKIENLHYDSDYYVRGYVKTQIGNETMLSYSSNERISTQNMGFLYDFSRGTNYAEITMSSRTQYEGQITEWSAAIRKRGDSPFTLADDTFIKAEDGKVIFKELETETYYEICMRGLHKEGYYIFEYTGWWSTLRKPSKDGLNSPTFK
jgi:hypothetical protein